MWQDQYTPLSGRLASTSCSPQAFDFILHCETLQQTRQPLQDKEPQERCKIDHPQQWWDYASKELKIGIRDLPECQPRLPLPIEGRKPGQQHPEEEQQQVCLQSVRLLRLDTMGKFCTRREGHPSRKVSHSKACCPLALAVENCLLACLSILEGVVICFEEAPLT